MALPRKTEGAPDDEAKQVPGIEDVLDESVLEVLRNIKPEDLIGSNPDYEAVKGNANPAGCWVHGPAMLEYNAGADKRLTKVAELDGAPQTKVEKVEVKLIPRTRLLVIRHAKPNDLTAIDVNRYNGASGCWINAFSVLAPAGLTIQSGYRVRYDVAYIPQGSPLWPGLIIDLGKPKERRREGKKKDNSTPSA